MKDSISLALNELPSEPSDNEKVGKRREEDTAKTSTAADISTATSADVMEWLTINTDTNNTAAFVTAADCATDADTASESTDDDDDQADNDELTEVFNKIRG